MKLDPARWPSSWVPAVPAVIMVLVVVAAMTGALHGTVGGVLVAVWFGVFGAIIWRADGIPWMDTASWTIPVVVWVAVAWFNFSEIPYVIAGLLAVAWIATFVFWLMPVRWWYRWVLRKDPPHGWA